MEAAGEFGSSGLPIARSLGVQAHDAPLIPRCTVCRAISTLKWHLKKNKYNPIHFFMYLPVACSGTWQHGRLLHAGPEGGWLLVCTLSSCNRLWGSLYGPAARRAQSLVPATTVHRAALDWSCLKTSLRPTCCKHLPKWSINQLETVYHEFFIPSPSPQHHVEQPWLGISGAGARPCLLSPVSLCILSSTDAALPSVVAGDSASVFCSICIWSMSSDKHHHVSLEVWIENELGNFRPR